MEMLYWESFVVTDQTMKTVKVFHHKQITLYGTVYMQNRALTVGKTALTFTSSQCIAIFGCH